MALDAAVARLMSALEIFYARDVDVVRWAAGHRRGELPDHWPYGLHRLPADLSVDPHRIRLDRLDQRILRRTAGPFDWGRRAPRGRDALCWDERTGVPVAATKRDGAVATGVIWLTEPDSAVGWSDRPVRYALGRCDAVWVLSQPQVEVLRGRWRLPESRVHYVPFGVDVDFWSPAADDPPHARDVVLAVGNDRHRDHAQVVAAAEAVQRTRPATRLCLVTHHDVPVPPAVGTREPALTHAELRSRYRGSAVVALAMRPNLHCSGVTAALEAMACARPVVATATAGMSDYIRDGVTGRLVPAGDVAAMAAAVAELLADPEAAQAMGRAARTAVEQRFSSELLARRIAAIRR